MSGASALSSEAARDFMDLTGATIVEGFGLSEASPVTHSNPMDGSGRIGSIGLPLPNTEVRVVDLETGRHDVATGEVGEMIVRGPQIMRGYLDDPAETAIALRDGWLFTGDLVRTDAAGFFQVVDRKKDMLKSGGLNVYPSEVEHVILQHPAVARCAVVGEPDPKYGEVVVAWVVVKSNAKLSTEELRDFCRHELASYKLPRIVRVCESLPENFLGKIRRVELRGRAA
jgi:long-chain acyl-CoA synthetase